MNRVLEGLWVPWHMKVCGTPKQAPLWGLGGGAKD